MQTIREVIYELDKIISHCERTNNRQGYFAILYRDMTIAVQRAIQEQLFADNVRMEKLDVIFAKRYLDAWNCYQQSQPCTTSWKTAFDAASLERLTVIQHLILGVNTHINLDLAIATAETAPGQDIFALQADYDRINKIIAATANTTQLKLEKLWVPMKMLTRIINNRQDAVINFSVEKARQVAWANAVAMALAEGSAAQRYIMGIDNTVNMVADKVINPGWRLNLILRLVKATEYSEVKRNMELLQ